MPPPAANPTHASCDPDTRIPFMAMPDAISALLTWRSAPRESLTRTAYNLTAFSPTAQQIHDAVERGFRAVMAWVGGREASEHRRFVAGGR